MTSIRGYADLLLGGRMGPINEMQKQFLGTIRGNVDRMTTLVSDLSDVARIESGRLRLEPRSMSMRAAIDDAVRVNEALLAARRQTLDVDVEPGLPPAWADPSRVGQILINLLSNANKYTPEGGRIRLSAGRHRGAEDGPAMLHVAVQDNGIGISPEDQKKLFQKFFRADDILVREMAAGTGLGLNIVKRLVEVQGGQIWFESQLRQGSTFHFTLPVAPSAPAAERGPSS
jgi:signal transduction histidine kinase